jgi:hypothetical protein
MSVCRDCDAKIIDEVNKLPLNDFQRSEEPVATSAR